MKKYRFKKIDAFATQKSEGNPAGYIQLETLKHISENEMLHIAKQLKGFVNEVGYVAQTGETEFDLRFYSSEREVDFCGHATIAILYDLITTNAALANKQTLTIHTNKGSLKVENKVKVTNSVFIMSPVPEMKKTLINIDELAEKLGVSRTKINMDLPISTINAGLTTLIVPIIDLGSILTIGPDLEILKNYCIEKEIDIIEVFTGDVKDKTNDFRTRVFAPTFGYLEDPATGSGNSALGYYLINNQMWMSDTLVIEQNGQIDNFNIVKLQKKTDENNIQRVYFGGGAITRIDGKYFIYN